MLRGLATVNFFADDVPAAQAWYAELLGVQPYFVREMGGSTAYVEFRIGDYSHELGIVDRRFAAARAAGPDADPVAGAAGSDPGAGAVVYWHVDDVNATFERLLAMGATVHEKPVERGPGFVTASIVDPFGNLLGVMYNKHYLDVLESHHHAA